MTFRKLLFWPHLIAGVVAGVVILIMSVTGTLLTYERQMVAGSDANFRSVPPADGGQRLPVETLITRVRASQPDLQINALTVGSEADAPVMVAVPQRPPTYIDAYSGAVLGQGSPTVRAVMTKLKAWHRWLAMEGEGRQMARAITGWSNFLFLFIVVSGMYLWLPRKWSWSNVKAVTLFRLPATSKARDFNWHNVIGIWSSIPLFIVVISAVPISFQWGGALVYRMVGEEVPRPPGREGGPGGREGGPAGRAGGPGGRAGGAPARAEAGPGGAEGRAPQAAEGRRGGREGGERARRPISTEGLNGLFARAEQQVPGWKTINMRVPNAPGAPVVFGIDRGDGGQPQLRSTLTLDRRSGDVVTYESFSDLTLGRRIRNVMRFAHTGEVLGLPGQTIAGLVTFGSVVLVWTGIALALRRLLAWVRRLRNPRIADAEQARENAA